MIGCLSDRLGTTAKLIAVGLLEPGRHACSLTTAKTVAKVSVVSDTAGGREERDRLEVDNDRIGRSAAERGVRSGVLVRSGGDKAMTMLDDQDMAALALTSRLVESPVKPLSFREFWALRRDVEPSALHGMTAADIASEHLVPSDAAVRVACLFDRSAALALAVETLDHSGIWTLIGVGPTFRVISQSAAILDPTAPPTPTNDEPLGDQLMFGFG